MKRVDNRQYKLTQIRHRQPAGAWAGLKKGKRGSGRLDRRQSKGLA